MITFKLNNQSVVIPTAWDEITFDHYLQMCEPMDTIKAVSILTHQDYELLKNATISGLDRLLEAVSFINTPPVLPSYVDKCGPYTIPGLWTDKKDGLKKFNIQYESLAQFEDARQVMIKMESGVQGQMKCYLKLVSIYLQKIKDGEYKPALVPDMEEDVKKFPAFEVMTLGAFFFLKLKSLLTGIKPISHHTTPHQKKSKQALKSSERNSVHTRK